jgi:hypothetical protein
MYHVKHPMKQYFMRHNCRPVAFSPEIIVEVSPVLLLSVLIGAMVSPDEKARRTKLCATLSKYIMARAMRGMDVAVFNTERIYMMPVKRHTLFIISAVILILIFLGMTPVKIGLKAANACPPDDGKRVICSTPCIFNTITSQNHTDDMDDARLLPFPVVFNSTVLPLGGAVDDLPVTVLNLLSETPLLRC